MPIFEYSCRTCGHRFEAIVQKQDNSVTCAACGSSDTGKMMSACSIKSGGKQGKAGAVSSSCAGCSSKNCSSCS